MALPDLSSPEDTTLRILMISDVYFPRVNGVSTSIQTFRRELQALGHQVTLIAPQYETESNDDADIIRIPSRRVLFDPEDRMMRRGPILELLPQLKEQGYDLIHIQTPFVAHYLGLRLAQELDVPVVESYHTFFEEYLYHYIPLLPRRWLKALARRFSRWQCNTVDGLVVPSSAMLDVLRQYGVRSEAAIIPTGLELKEFSHGNGAAFRLEHGISPERPVLVFVGRVAFEKNIDFLLRMLLQVRQEIPDVLLVIAGMGPAVDKLKAMTERLALSDNVMFLGYLSRNGELQSCYDAGDAFVFASRTETQGLVLLEAMALGVPVVSTAVMGTRDVLRAGEGALIAPEDEAGFAGAVITLLRDHDRRAALAVAARHYAAGWSAPQLAQRLSNYYQDIAVAELEQEGLVRPRSDACLP